MPKVSEEYVQKKKNSIIEAALNVCQEKPLYEITMTDIIQETGLSQGGIYLYFTNLDEILIAVINKVNSHIDYKDKIDKIIENDSSSVEKIEMIFSFLGSYIKENMNTMGKFQFELTVLLANHPERQAKFMSQLTEIEKNQYLINKLFETINRGIKSGEFKPEIPVQELFMFITTSIDGIVRDTVLQKCYGPVGNLDSELDEVSLLNILSRSVILLLNVR